MGAGALQTNFQTSHPATSTLAVSAVLRSWTAAGCSLRYANSTSSFTVSSSAPSGPAMTSKPTSPAQKSGPRPKMVPGSQGWRWAAWWMSAEPLLSTWRPAPLDPAEKTASKGATLRCLTEASRSRITASSESVELLPFTASSSHTADMHEPLGTRFNASSALLLVSWGALSASSLLFRSAPTPSIRLRTCGKACSTSSKLFFGSIISSASSVTLTSAIRFVAYMSAISPKNSPLRRLPSTLPSTDTWQLPDCTKNIPSPTVPAMMSVWPPWTKTGFMNLSRV
mmetsp:Transcript_57001/g.133690  ORF Transcript_57001/g.133690 Transcript_57001/m.133690 type:complete len:283 (-) Transcript_57001:1067-1915(-)